MDINITQAHQRTLQPRLFWRRAIAYLIDMTIFEIVLGAAMLVVPLNFGTPLFESTQCEEVTSGPLVEKVEREWPLKPAETRGNQICLTREILGLERRYFQTTVITDNAGGASASWRSVSVALDQNGDPVEGIGDIVGPLVGVFLVSLAFSSLSANGRRTLGKKILAIRVVTVEGAPPHFRRALRRELLKLSPWIAFVGVDTIVAASTSQGFDAMLRSAHDGDASITIQIVVSAVLSVFALVWWLLPLIRWRGQMFYDQLTGCAVRRT
ncbi:RDD family protein [Sinorhizobium sp. B11]